MRSVFFICWVVCILSSVQVFADQWYCIDSVSFGGNVRTKEQFLLRELGFKRNECVSEVELPQLLELARQRLQNTALYNFVSVDTFNVDGRKTVVFNMEERFPVMPKPNLEFADRNFNVWWAEQNHKLDRLNIGLALLHQNMRGRRETIGVEVQHGYTPKLAISYDVPFLDKQQHQGIGAAISVLQNKEIAYTTIGNKLRFKRFEQAYALRQMEASVWYSYRPAFNTTHFMTLSWSNIGIHDSVALLYNSDYLGKGRRSLSMFGLQYKLQYNAVDNWNYPLVGQRLISRLGIQMVQDYGLMPSAYLQADWYRRLATNTYAGVIFRGRKVWAKNMPYILQKNMGYDYDEMRGYEYYVMDGNLFALLRGNLKYRIMHHRFSLPVRYFHHVPLSVFVKAYADGGYAYQKAAGANFLNNQLLYSYGIGIDIVTLYDIRIRIEYTFNKQGQSDLYLHKSGE